MSHCLKLDGISSSFSCIIIDWIFFYRIHSFEVFLFVWSVCFFVCVRLFCLFAFIN
jgi:hypothetical protein